MEREKLICVGQKFFTNNSLQLRII